MLEWQVYYGDGSTFGSSEGHPSLAPNINVQGVLVRDDVNGDVVWSGFDWYLYVSERWIGVRNMVSLVDQILNNFENISNIKKGRTVPDEEFDLIKKK